jgi:hypothetical protein
MRIIVLPSLIMASAIFKTLLSTSITNMKVGMVFYATFKRGAYTTVKGVYTHESCTRQPGWLSLLRIKQKGLISPTNLIGLYKDNYD